MNRQRQHIRRPGVAAIAAASVAAYGAYKLGLWAWSTWADDDPEVSVKERAKHEPERNSKEKIAQQRFHILRRKRILRCREDSLSLMRSFAVVLQRSLEEATDTCQERRKLKQLRRNVTKGIDSAQEDALWLKIQESTLTRMVAGAYLQAILVTVVTVQVNLLGGYMFHTAAMEPISMSTDYADCGAVITATSFIHQKVLERTFHRLVDHCVKSVLESVRSAVLHSIDNCDWDMKNASSALHMTHHAFLTTIHRIRTEVEGSCPHQHARLQKYFVAPAVASNAEEGNDVADVVTEVDNIMNEAWDLLDSPAASCALADCVNHVFAKMDEKLWVPVFADETDQPIASIISQLRIAADHVFEKDCCNSALMADLASVVEVADLSFN